MLSFATLQVNPTMTTSATNKHPTASCDQEEESVEHIKKYIAEREMLKKGIRKQSSLEVSIKYILNGHNNKSALNYLRRTGLNNRI